MSLKARLAVALILAFAGIAVLGAALTFWQARQTLTIELAAAERVAANRIEQLVTDLPSGPAVTGELESFVRSFNGDRHVEVMLLDGNGAVRMRSHSAEPETRVPGWFIDFVVANHSTFIMPLPEAAAPATAAAVSINPRNELADTWLELLVAFGILGAFVFVAFVAIWLVADRAMKPLGGLRDALHRIGAGDSGVRVAPKGPPEFAALGKSFNRMAEELDALSRRNRRLAEQLQQLQDEERAELARDLHDEIGPLLFGIDVDAAAIARRAGAEKDETTAQKAGAVRAAAQSARQAVRRILSDLRPGVLPGLGLKRTIETFAEGVAERHPGVWVECDVVEGEWPELAETIVYRAVKEGVQNALRHGRPRHIAVSVRLDDAGALAFRVTDDGGGLSRDWQPGYGLTGMRERVETAGGRLDIAATTRPAGVRVEGSVPLDTRQSREQFRRDAA